MQRSAPGYVGFHTKSWTFVGMVSFIVASLPSIPRSFPTGDSEVHGDRPRPTGAANEAGAGKIKTKLLFHYY